VSKGLSLEARSTQVRPAMGPCSLRRQKNSTEAAVSRLGRIAARGDAAITAATRTPADRAALPRAVALSAHDLGASACAVFCDRDSAEVT